MLDLSRIHDMQMSSILANHPDRKAIINPNRMAVAEEYNGLERSRLATG